MRHLGKGVLTTHRRGSRTKPHLASGSFTTSKAMPWSAAAAIGADALQDEEAVQGLRVPMVALFAGWASAPA